MVWGREREARRRLSPPPASQTDSRSSHPRYVSGKISPTSSPNFRPLVPPALLRAGGPAADSQGEPLVPPEPPAITTLLRPGLRDRARPSSSLAYFSCPLSLTVSSKRHRQRVRVCLGTAGGYLLHCQHTSKARGRPLLLHGKEGY